MIGMNVAVSVASEGTVSVQFICLAQSKKVPFFVVYVYQEFCVRGEMINILLNKVVLTSAEEWAAGV